MLQESRIINKFTQKDYLNATGPIEIGMTNDYMFRIVFQQNKFALKGLIASVLHIDPESIIDLEVKNTIAPGVKISDKEYRMDILATMNNDQTIDIEMQIKNYDNWPERSLSYLCRTFDELNHGEDYVKAHPVYQIGFLDFTLFDDHPEFRATYQLRNAKDNYLYTDKFNLIVIELRHEKLATKEDIAYGITDWVRLFKSKTWEELKMVAENNEYISSTLESMYLSNADYNVIKIAREREDFLRYQEAREKKISDLTQEVSSLASENSNLSQEVSSLTTENSNLTQEVSSLASENSKLKELLETNGISY